MFIKAVDFRLQKLYNITNFEIVFARRKKTQELPIEMENELGLKRYINGVPDIKEIPPEKFESILAVLEMKIGKYYQKENSPYSDLKEEQA